MFTFHRIIITYYRCLLAYFDFLFEQTGFTIKQQVFDKDIPTPLLLFDFLQALPANLYTAVAEDDNDDEPYNPWKESDDTKVSLSKRELYSLKLI